MTTAPGAAVAALAVFTIVSPGVSTATVTWHGAVIVPGGHDDPAADDAADTISSLSPVSGLSTVTENVTVAVAPGRQAPGPRQHPAGVRH